jgi:hypothetical protein
VRLLTDIQVHASGIVCCLGLQYSAKTKLRGFSLQTNYIDRVTTACRRSWCQLLRIEVVAWSAQRITTAVNLGFLDPEPLL